MIEKVGPVDGLINNAGIIQPFVDVKDLTWEKIDQVIHVNFYGQLYFIKALLPELLKRQEAHIVNISSMGGFLPVPGQVVYGASKAAVKLMSEGLYAELKDTPVGVSLILPGGINTDIAKRSGVEVSAGASESAAAKFLLSPEKAASLIIDAMEKNKLSTRIGKDSNVFHFLYKHFPKFAIHTITRFMKQ
jgi:short-subunit dehydrogenase